MLLILTFGAIVNSPRFYLRAWGKEPFISPVPVGDTVMYSSSRSPLQRLSFGHAEEAFLLYYCPQGCQSCWNFQLYSLQFLNLLSSVGRCRLHQLSASWHLTAEAAFSVSVLPLKYTHLSNWCETLRLLWVAWNGFMICQPWLAKGSWLRRVFRCLCAVCYRLLRVSFEWKH